jgi:hypothetical protein
MINNIKTIVYHQALCVMKKKLNYLALQYVSSKTNQTIKTIFASQRLLPHIPLPLFLNHSGAFAELGLIYDFIFPNLTYTNTTSLWCTG